MACRQINSGGVKAASRSFPSSWHLPPSRARTSYQGHLTDFFFFFFRELHHCAMVMHSPLRFSRISNSFYISEKMWGSFHLSRGRKGMSDQRSSLGDLDYTTKLFCASVARLTFFFS